MADAPSAPLPDGEDLTRRQCARCRQWFALGMDEQVERPAGVGAEWWLCPPCRLALLGPTTPPPGRTR